MTPGSHSFSFIEPRKWSISLESRDKKKLKDFYTKKVLNRPPTKKNRSIKIFEWIFFVGGDLRKKEEEDSDETLGNCHPIQSDVTLIELVFKDTCS